MITSQGIMTTKLRAVLFIMLLLLVSAMVYLKMREYQIRIRDITYDLGQIEGKNGILSRDLKTLQAKYNACTNDEMISAQRSLPVSFSFGLTGVYSPLLATQSGSMDTWEYKETKQIEYQANLEPYNQFHVRLILYATDLPNLLNGCGNSPIDPTYSVCGFQKLALSEFSFRGLTLKGLPYYQKMSTTIFHTPEYVTIIQLPGNEQQQKRLLKITYDGKTTDSGYQQYLSLINEVDIKTY